jgi:hypothetical protein
MILPKRPRAAGWAERAALATVAANQSRRIAASPKSSACHSTAVSCSEKYVKTLRPSVSSGALRDQERGERDDRERRSRHSGCGIGAHAASPQLPQIHTAIVRNLRQ